MKILYFTATGNSLYVAKSLGDQLFSIPQMMKEGKFEFTDDVIGIVFPLHEWKVNSYVEDFLKQAKFNCDYLFAITTYGVYTGAVGSHLQDLGSKYGYKFDYINKVQMVDSYLYGFDMDRQVKIEGKKEIEKQIAAIKGDIESRKKWEMKERSVDKAATNFMRRRVEKPKAENHLAGIKKRIIIEESCVKCGVCVKVCPLDNISLDEASGEIKLANKCISCLACVQNCPQKAIQLKGQRSRARFRNRHVTLGEIIKSNDQTPAKSLDRSQNK